MKRVILTVFAVLLALLIAPIGYVIGFQKTSAYAQDAIVRPEEEIQRSTTLDDDFADNRVLVTLKDEKSKKLKAYSKKDFSEISCSSVSDIAGATDEIAESRQLMSSDIGNSKTVLSIELSEKSKVKVLETIEELKKRDDVLYAEPDYRMTFFAAPNPTPTY